MKTNEQLINATENLHLFDADILAEKPELVAKIRAWAMALRSGSYKQGIRYLHLGNTYCCLGVAQSMFGLKEHSAVALRSTYKELALCDSKGTFDTPDSVTITRRLSRANDIWNWTFEDIATFIENQLNAVLAQQTQEAV